MTRPKILIIEDDAALATALGVICERIGGAATLCASGQLGLQELARGIFSLVVLDIGLPDMSGWGVLESVNQSPARPPALIITAQGTLDNAIAARQFGARGYLVKPLDLRELERAMRDLLAEAAPVSPVPSSSTEASALLGGASAEMQRAFMTIAQAAMTDAPCLITGPTGTGKTLAARVVHANSRRRDGPFVTLVCGSLPEQLLESELFGHEKNAFTGAGACGRATWNARAAARCSWTRSRTFRRPCKPNSFVLSRKRPLTAWAAGRTCGWICAWSPRRIVPCATKSRRAVSARTFITGCMCWKSKCRP